MIQCDLDKIIIGAMATAVMILVGFLLGLTNYTYTYLSVHKFTNMSALFLVTSIIIFMMGLISEQITQTRYDRIENGG